MQALIRTDATNDDFLKLLPLLDAELAITDGDEHDFYRQYNGVETIKYVVLFYDRDQAVACGAIKAYNADTMEIKRMYTLPAYRGKGIAGQILEALENWALALGYHRCILETGVNQEKAIHRYEKSGYQRITRYGQYANAVNSVCMGKLLA